MRCALFFAAVVACVHASNYTISMYEDASCSSFDGNVTFTKMSATCDQEVTDEGTQSSKNTNITCGATTGVTYTFVSCDSADCSGSCDGRTGTGSFTVANYAKYLIGQCTQQTTVIAGETNQEYFKITAGTPPLLCDSANIIMPSALLVVIALARAYLVL
jgi:hypothetical protein